MTQQEKAREVLDRLFFQPRYAKVGVSEKFLREYATKKWVGKDVPLNPDVLIDEAEERVLSGELISYSWGHQTQYKPPAKRERALPNPRGTQKEQPGSTLASGPRLL